jgi:hypothetical protein
MAEIDGDQRKTPADQQGNQEERRWFVDGLAVNFVFSFFICDQFIV